MLSIKPKNIHGNNRVWLSQVCKKCSIFLSSCFPGLTQDCLPSYHDLTPFHSVHVHGTIVLLVSKVCFVKYWLILRFIAHPLCAICACMLKKCCHGEIHVILLNVAMYVDKEDIMTKTIMTHEVSLSCCGVNIYASYVLASLMGLSRLACSWTQFRIYL